MNCILATNKLHLQLNLRGAPKNRAEIIPILPDPGSAGVGNRLCNQKAHTLYQGT